MGHDAQPRTTCAVCPTLATIRRAQCVRMRSRSRTCALIHAGLLWPISQCTKAQAQRNNALSIREKLSFESFTCISVNGPLRERERERAGPNERAVLPTHLLFRQMKIMLYLAFFLIPNTFSFFIASLYYLAFVLFNLAFLLATLWKSANSEESELRDRAAAIVWESAMFYYPLLSAAS